MTLALQMIVSCVFASMETFCDDNADPQDEMIYAVKQLDFELPKVRCKSTYKMHCLCN